MTTLLLAAALQVLTLPVATNLMSRSTYMARGIAVRVDNIDELAEYHALEEVEPGPEDDRAPRARTPAPGVRPSGDDSGT